MNDTHCADVNPQMRSVNFTHNLCCDFVPETSKKNANGNALLKTTATAQMIMHSQVWSAKYVTPLSSVTVFQRRQRKTDRILI